MYDDTIKHAHAIALVAAEKKNSAISSEINDGKSGSNLTQINDLGWCNSARLIVEDALDISVIHEERG